MAKRKYTVTEIDALRDICRNKVIWGVYSHRNSTRKSSRAFNQDEVDASAERMTRTFMEAGKTAGEIVAEETEAMKDSVASWQKMIKDKEEANGGVSIYVDGYPVTKFEYNRITGRDYDEEVRKSKEAVERMKNPVKTEGLDSCGLSVVPRAVERKKFLGIF